MNKEDYIISIVGEQKYEDERDNSKINLDTLGTYFRRGKAWHITYREYDEDSPHRFFNNLIKVENNMVTISRKGPQRSRLMLEKNRRHQCIYGTPAGNLSIGVFTKTLNSTLGEKGGTLEVSYTLDFNTDLVSENRFFIRVEEKNATSPSGPDAFVN